VCADRPRAGLYIRKLRGSGMGLGIVLGC
jgi:hypothetical protein